MLHAVDPDTIVNIALYDALCNIDPASDRFLVRGLHPVVFGELVDLNTSEFADITNLLAFQVGEVLSDAVAVDVHDAGE